MAVHQQFQGPLPPPQLLHQYENIVPGSARAIVDTFMEESRHRRDLENRAVAAEIEQAEDQVRLQKRGQIFGFTIAMTATLGGLALAWSGQPVAGGLLGGAALAAIVVAFLRSTSTPTKSEKRD